MDVLSEVLHVLQLTGTTVSRREIGSGKELKSSARGRLTILFALREPVSVASGTAVYKVGSGDGLLLGDGPEEIRVRGSGRGVGTVVDASFSFDRSAPHPVTRDLRRTLHVFADSLTDRTDMGRTLALLEEELINRRIGSTRAAQRFADVLLLEMLRRQQLNETGTPSFFLALQDSVVVPILEHLHAQPGSPWTQAALGDLVSLTPGAMAERFQRHVGLPPLTYLRQWRLLTGRARLTSSGVSIGAVARSLGYASTGGFSRAFRTLFGSSPLKYRRQAGAES